MKNYLIALPVLALAVGLTGCGAGNSAPAAQVSRSAGKAVVTVKWPAQVSPSRVIPGAANSVKITLTGGGTIAPLVKTITRPDTSASFTNLIGANYTMTAETFASADGTGTVLATAGIPVTVVAGETATPTLTLASTVDTIDYSYLGGTVAPGAVLAVSIAGRDVNNNVIPLTASALTWSSSDSSVVSVTNAGVVTGVAGGRAVITVTDTESGKQANFEVICLALTGPSAVAPMDVNGTQTFAVNLVGPTDTSVTWSVQEGMTGGSVTSSGIYTAPATRGTYHVVATSVYDSTRTFTIPVTVTAGGVAIGVN